MLQVEDGTALPQVGIAEHLGRIEHGATRDPAAGQRTHRLVLVALRGPALDHRGEFFAVAGPRRRRAEALVGADILATDDVHQRLEGLDVVRRQHQVDVVIRSAPCAAYEVGVGAARRAIAHALEGLARREGRRELHARDVQHGFLHGHFDELAAARPLPLHERGEDGDGQVHAGARIPHVDAGDHRRTIREAGEAHAAARRLRDHLEALEVAVGAVRAEAFDGRVDRPRVQPLHGLVSEPQALHRAWPQILGDDVRLADEPPRDLLALVGFQIQHDAALVAVEQQEEVAVDVGPIAVPELSGPVTVRWTLDLDHVGAEPGQSLRARRTGLVVREVDDTDALQGFAHRVTRLLGYARMLARRPGRQCCCWKYELTRAVSDRAAGSQITLTHAGTPAFAARSSAGRMSSGRSTRSPWPPSASTMRS